MVACAILGTIGLLLGRGPMPWSVAVGLLLVAVAAGLQLVPLDPATLERVSPAAVTIHREQNLAVAMGTTRELTLSIDPSRTRLGLAFLGAFGALLIGSARMLGRGSARQLATGIVMLGVALALVGIIQRATFNGKIYWFWVPQQGGTPFGPFVNANHFAGWMLMGVPLAIGAFAASVSRGMKDVKPGFRERLLWFSSPEANKSLLLAFAVLTMTLALVLTLSRSGMLGMAGALLLASIVMARRQTSRPRRAILRAYLLFVALLVVSWVGLDRIAAEFSEIDPTSINERPAIWADTIRIAQAFWLTGTGLNTYGVSTLYYQTSIPGQHLREAHNDYLQLAAEGGVLLAVPIVATIAAFVWAVRRRLREDVGSIWWIRMGAVTGLLAIAVQSLVEFSLQMPGNAAMFAVLCGVALHDGRRR
jgi:O-antigen ligase